VSDHGGAGVFAKADYYEAGPGVHVYSWCPTPDGSGPATQVHLHIGTPPGPVMVIRLKSALVTDEVVAALQEHRALVWGKSK
jgi:hypothetical protein